jgi:uncharacterized membrane protein YqaE (UPF0057 family)
MRKYKKLLLIAIVGSFLFSCSTSNNVVSSKLFQKRKYQKGWHVNSTNKIDRVKKAEKTEYEEGLVAQNERVEDEPVQKNERTETKKEVTIQATENKAEVVVNNNVEEQNGTKSELKTKKELNNFEAITLEVQSNTNQPIKKEKTDSTQSNNSSGFPMLLLIILCFILPPLAVGLVRGWTVKEFIISILLTLLLWLPGVIYALLIIFDMI